MACVVPAVVLLVLNLMGAAAVMADKRAARSRRVERRVPERALLLLAVIGAWAGMLLAMLRVRHKTRDGWFLARFLGASAASAVLLWAWGGLLGCW